jgi:UDP-N-acetylmuramate--alanine ligase
LYKKTKHIHFVGIGGIGMSGIAEVLINLGYTVSGSDMRASDITRKLEDLGGRIHIGHRAGQGEGADVFVTSSAIAADNAEVQVARDNHIPIIQRAEMLAELMRLKTFGIAVAGSHGKTTTTSILSTILFEAGMDPTMINGGKVDRLGGNAKLGAGEFLVAEADESDGSFLKLDPVIEVVTNIDLEHCDYYRDLDHIKETFLRFIEKIPFYGAVVLCFDDPNIVSLLPQIEKRVITYGLSEQADLYGGRISTNGCTGEFSVFFRDQELGRVRLRVPGRHTIYNALAAIGVALELEIEFPVIAAALERYAGVQRRLQVKGEVNDILVVDDYGHHPTEIRATLDAVRDAWPERRLVVAFQPHRYSRTKALFEEFTVAFHRADVLLLTDIYAASEEPINGVDTEHLLEAIRRYGQRNVYYEPTVAGLPARLAEIIEPGDLVLTLGAGNIVRAGELLLEQMTGEQSNGRKR